MFASNRYRVVGLTVALSLAACNPLLAQSSGNPRKAQKRSSKPPSASASAALTNEVEFKAGKVELGELVREFAGAFDLKIVGDLPEGSVTLADAERMDFASALESLREWAFAEAPSTPNLLLVRDDELHIKRAADIPATLPLDRVFPAVSEFEAAEVDDWEPVIVQYTPPSGQRVDLPAVQQLVLPYMRLSPVAGSSAVRVFGIARDVRRFVELARQLGASSVDPTDAAPPAGSRRSSPAPAPKRAAERRAATEQGGGNTAPIALAAPAAAEPAPDSRPQVPAPVHVDVIIYRIEGPIERLIEVDGAALSDGASTDVQKALAEFGTVHPLYRISQLADLRMKNRMVVGARTPFIRNAAVTNTGQKQSQIEYEDIGAECEFTGEWVGGQVAARLDIELAALGPSAVAIADDIQAPMFQSIKHSLSGLIEPGQPTFIVSVDGAAKSGSGHAVAYVASVLLKGHP